MDTLSIPNASSSAEEVELFMDTLVQHHVRWSAFVSNPRPDGPARIPMQVEVGPVRSWSLFTLDSDNPRFNLTLTPSADLDLLFDQQEDISCTFELYAAPLHGDAPLAQARPFFTHQLSREFARLRLHQNEDFADGEGVAVKKVFFGKSKRVCYEMAATQTPSSPALIPADTQEVIVTDTAASSAVDVGSLVIDDAVESSDSSSHASPPSTPRAHIRTVSADLRPFNRSAAPLPSSEAEDLHEDIFFAQEEQESFPPAAAIADPASASSSNEDDFASLAASMSALRCSDTHQCPSSSLSVSDPVMSTGLEMGVDAPSAHVYAHLFESAPAVAVGAASSNDNDDDDEVKETVAATSTSSLATTSSSSSSLVSHPRQEERASLMDVSWLCEPRKPPRLEDFDPRPFEAKHFTLRRIKMHLSLAELVSALQS